MSMIEELRRRWRPEWDNDPTKSNTRYGFLRALRVAEAMLARKAEVTANDRLSDKGKADALRSFADEARAEIHTLQSKVQQDAASMSDWHARLPGMRTDHANIPAAMLRQEIRAHFRQVGHAAAVAAIMQSADLTLLQALIEGPAPLSGFTTDQRDQAVARLLSAKFPEAVAHYEDAKKALELANIALGVAKAELMSAVGIEDEAAFNEWLEAA